MHPGILAKPTYRLHPRILVSVESEKRSVSYRLPADLIRLVEEEAVNEGRVRTAGRMFNPSATVERILRAYFKTRRPGDRPPAK